MEGVGGLDAGGNTLEGCVMILTISSIIAFCLIGIVVTSGSERIDEPVRLVAFVVYAMVALGCAVKLLEIVLK